MLQCGVRMKFCGVLRLATAILAVATACIGMSGRLGGFSAWGAFVEPGFRIIFFLLRIPAGE